MKVKGSPKTKVQHLTAVLERGNRALGWTVASVPGPSQSAPWLGEDDGRATPVGADGRFYYQTPEARDKRIAKLCESAEKGATSARR